MKVKNIILTTLLACMLCMSVEAMKREHEDNGDEQRDNEMVCSSQDGSCNYPFENLPAELEQAILDILNQGIIPHQEHSAFPVLCLRAIRELVNFSQTHHACRDVVLEYIETKIINQLIRFDRQNNSITLNHEDGKDLVAACFAFKILAGIRRTSPNFCDAQYNLVCNFLIAHGIITGQEIQQYNNNPCSRYNLYDVAKSENITDLTRAIIAGIDIESRDEALSCPACYCNINIIQALLALGANIHTITNARIGCWGHGRTVLHWALEYGTISVINYLLAAIPDEQKAVFVNTPINNPGNWSHGWTALHLALKNCPFAIHIVDINPEVINTLIVIINTLINAGADVNARIINTETDPFFGSHNGWTVLHLAIENTHASVNIIQTLINASADVNATINNPGHREHNMTALHLAAQLNNTHAAQALINAGAHVPECLILQLQGMGVNITMENMWNQ